MPPSKAIQKPERTAVAKRGGARGSARETTPREPRDASRWALPSVLCAIVAVYLPTLRFNFVYDDSLDIVQNPAIQSWTAMPGYFFPRGGQMLGPSGWHADRFYRPLFLLWLRVNYALFGLEPALWHLAAVAVHLLATLLLYRLVYRVTARRRVGDWLTAALAALFFGLHPVHVQVISWVSVVSESLLCSALLGSLLCYVDRNDVDRNDVGRNDVGRNKAGREKRGARYAASLVLFGLALLIKETAVVYPAVLFAYAWCYADEPGSEADPSREPMSWLRRTGMAMREALPFVGLSLAYLSVRWAVLKTIVVPGGSPAAYGSVLFSIPSALLFYARLLVWPLGLSPLYAFPVVRQADFGGFAVPLLMLLLIAAVLGWALWSLWGLRHGLREKPHAGDAGGHRERWRLALFGCAWIVFLLPALNLTALPEEQLVQDRYLYLPSVGFAMLLALAIESLAAERLGSTKWTTGSRMRLLGVPVTAAIPALLLACCMAAVSIEESQIWSSQLALFTRAVEKAPHSKIAGNNYAVALLQAHRFDEAIPVLRSLVAKHADPLTLRNLIAALEQNGNLPEAEQWLAEACRRNPQAPDLYRLGVMRVNAKHPESALEPLRRAVELDPKAVGYHFAYGLAFDQLGNRQPAAEQYRLELALDPANGTARQLLTQIEPAAAQAPVNAESQPNQTSPK